MVGVDLSRIAEEVILWATAEFGFVRLDDARDRDRGGAGLGLPIAREVARENGGDVVLEDSPTGGLRVTVTVPVGVPGEQVADEPVGTPADESR